MLAKTTIALATVVILGVASVAQAATKDKENKAGSGMSRSIQPLNYPRYGNPRFFRDEPQALNPVTVDDVEGYPHPR